MSHMNKQVQVTCHEADWDASILFGCNIPLNGRVLTPRRLVAADLPAAQLAVWHDVVEQLKGLAPGEWTATLIVAERGEKQPDAPTGEAGEPSEEPSLEQQPIPIVRAEVYRKWDDGTTAEPIGYCFEEAAVLELFDWLVSPEAYGLGE